MIAFVGRALLALLCAMTAPRPPVPDLPPVQPPPGVGMCVNCKTEPCRDGSDFFCGDTCQRDWTAVKNRTIPLEATPPVLPDGSTYRRTTP